MAEEGKMIAYTYDYHRLTGISYSDHPENDVKYYYGGRNASHNRIGRLMMREDRTGAIEYFYDKMGEVTKITARLQVDDNGFVPSYWYDTIMLKYVCFCTKNIYKRIKCINLHVKTRVK